MLKEFILVIFMGLELIPALPTELDTEGQRSLGKILGRNVEGLINSENDGYAHSGNQNYNENSNTVRRHSIRIPTFRDRDKLELSTDGESVIRNSKRGPKNSAEDLIEMDLGNENHKRLANGDNIPVEIISGDNPSLVEKSPRKKSRKKSSRIKGNDLKIRETVSKITGDSAEENPLTLVTTKLKKVRSEKEKKRDRKMRTGKKERYQIKDPGDTEDESLPDLLEFYKNYMEIEPTRQGMTNVNVNNNRNVASLEDDDDVYEFATADNNPSMLRLTSDEGELENPVRFGQSESDETRAEDEVTELGKGRDSNGLIELAKATTRDLKETMEHRAKTNPISEEDFSVYETLPEDEDSTSTSVEYIEKMERKLDPPELLPPSKVVVIPVRPSQPKILTREPKVKKIDDNTRSGKAEIKKLVALLERPRIIGAEEHVNNPMEIPMPGNNSMDYVDPILSAFKVIPKLRTISRVKSRVESSSAYHYTMGDKIISPPVKYVDDYDTEPDQKYLTDHTGMDNVLAEIMRYIFGLRPGYDQIITASRRNRKLVAPEIELHRQPYPDKDHMFE